MTGISEGMAESQALWRMWKTMEGGGEVGRDERSVPDELTLAAFAEGKLAGDEHAAVADLLAAHPDLAADVAAAMASATVSVPNPSLASVIARAQGLVAAPGDGVVQFRTPPFRVERGHHGAGGTSWRMAARWGSLAASFALVSWLGFALGNDAYGSLAALDLRTSPPAGVTDELLDPPSGFFDLGEVSGT